MLLPQDLSILHQLCGRVSLPIADIAQILPTLQRLEAAMKDGKVLAPVDPNVPDVGSSAGGSE